MGLTNIGGLSSAYGAQLLFFPQGSSSETDEAAATPHVTEKKGNMAKRRFIKGDIVTVNIPDVIPKESPVWRYDGQKLKVARAIYKRKAPIAQLEFEEAVSSAGTPYTFLGDWVKLISEGEEK